ncbi:hypothetical protein BJY04DRAFT_199908 [Aspergillus karnatakaensis]|uniref:uncharacterized protein n=1 Tax=Aspergillus karnatakaensis TaxID=1810916 RepID=UPI003CCD94B3
MGYCHNDLAPRNCLLDRNLNLRLCDFDLADTVGQLLEGTRAPWARHLVAGPLKGTYGLCGTKTELFALGTLVYYMVYGCESYEEENLACDNPSELHRRFDHFGLPDLNRHKVLNLFVSSCWHNVFPTMAGAVYWIKRETKDFALEAVPVVVDYAKEKRNCEKLIRQGLLGSELALAFQPAWRRCLHSFVGKASSLWYSLGNFVWRPRSFKL